MSAPAHAAAALPLGEATEEAAVVYSCVVETATRPRGNVITKVGEEKSSFNKKNILIGRSRKSCLRW